MARVFVSFATPDLPVAREVVDWLRADGHDVFLDRDAVSGIAAGEEWRQRLYAELRQVDGVISIVTPASVGSTWCAVELGIADALGCLLIPLRAAADARHPLLEHRQYVDYLGDPQAARARVLDSLRHVDGETVGRRWRDGKNPFPGLEPFPSSAAAVFFGRSAEVRDLANRLRAARSGSGGILAVVGPSGCGKSSVLNAGLLALLAHDAEWVTCTPWLPGDDPLSGLARSLTHTAQRSGLCWSAPGVRRELGADPRGLRRAADDLLDARPTAYSQRLLVPVDQGEELFTRADPTQRAFVAALLREAARGPVQPVLTLRSEFLDDLRALPDLEGTPIETFTLPPLSRDLLTSVIEGPARVAGLRLEPELAPRLVDDTGSGDALPLLAFTLRQLSDGLGRGDTLTVARYTALGGVQGALARHADDALAAAVATTGLTEHDVLAGLVRLVTIDDAGRWSRRRVEIASLPERIRAATQVLVDRRLLVIDSIDGVDTVGVAHEALLTAWPPLRRAIDERLLALQAARTVEQAAADWQRDGRPEHYLWDDKRLAGARAHLGAPDGDDTVAPVVHLDPTGRAFLEASGRRARTVQRQAQRRRRSLVTGLSVLLVLALLAAGTAVWQTREAQESTREAQESARIASARSLLAQADVAREGDPRTALQLAGAAYGLDPSPAAEASLIETLASAPALHRTLVGHEAAVAAIAVSGDGRTLVSGDVDGIVLVWDLTDPDRSVRIGAPVRAGPGVRALALAADARLLALADTAQPPVVTLWDLTDRADPRVVGRPLDLDGPADVGLSFAPDGRTLAVIGDDTRVRLWDTADPASPRPLGRPIGEAVDAQDRSALLASFSADGQTLVTASRSSAVVWDVSDRANPRERGRTPPNQDHPAVIGLMAISGDARTIALSTGSGVELWDMTDPARPRRLPVPPALHLWVDRLAFTADGRSLVVAAEGGITMWTVRPDGLASRGAASRGGVERVNALAAVGGGHTAVSAGTDGALTLWALAAVDPAPERGLPLLGEEGVFAPDGPLLAVRMVDETVVLHDTTDPTGPRPVGRPLPGPGRYGQIAFSADARLLALGSRDNTVTLWDLADPENPRRVGEPIRVAPPDPENTYDPDDLDSLALSADGATLATLQNAAEVRLWDITHASNVVANGRAFGAEKEGFSGLSISRDGTRLAVGRYDGSMLWDLTDRARPVPTRVDGDSPRFLPDDRTLATAVDAGIALWDVTDPRRPGAVGLPFAAPSQAFALSWDGRTLAAFAGANPTVVLWDLTDRTRPRRLGGLVVADAYGAHAVSFSPNGRTAAVSTNKGVVLHDLTRLDEIRRDPLEQTCARAGGPLTPALWNTYAPGLDYQDACAGR